MKIISLNTWGGRVHEPLMKFIEANNDTDIFCLQEIYKDSKKPLVEYKDDNFNLYSDIQKILPDHIGYFKPSIESYGIALFVKNNIHIEEEGEISIYDVSDYVSGANHPRNLQYVRFELNGKKLTVAHVHGLWNGMGKTDTEHRLEQSRRIKKFTDSVEGNIILCGDFNLRPDTESVKILEEGMRNLVKEYEVTSTRTSFYEKPEKFADYIFTSPEIEVLDFKVLPDEVSDHSALQLIF